MYAEFRQISLLGMSNSELFLVKDGDEGIEFDDPKRPTLKFQEDSQASATSSSSSHDVPDHGDQERQVVLEDPGEKKEKETNVTALKETNDDDDDGFKTPTSLDHKIPEAKQCPPAPRKPKPLPSSNKRKPSPTSLERRNLPIDLSQEVESLFSRHKFKKPRTQENQ